MKRLKIGITGAHGFIGGHLKERLARDANCVVATCERSHFDDPPALEKFVTECDAIVHLAAVIRGDENDIYATSLKLTGNLIDALERTASRPHLIFLSSTLRDSGSAYGRSKRDGEQLLTEWAGRAGGRVTNLITPNVYGAGCKPFFNSVVATFCHQLTHGEQPTVIQDRDVEFIHVSQLVDRIAEQCLRPAGHDASQRVAPTMRMTVRQLLDTLQGFRDDYFVRRVVPDLTDPIRASLYTTYLSYLEPADHIHPTEVHRDDRGELFEIIRLANAGQIFFSTTRPGVVRGNHYHRRKIEWFCVVKGEAIIRLRRIGRRDVHEFRVSGNQPRFISIPVFHTHHIENVGDGELLTMFWCNEILDRNDIDTYFEKVVLDEIAPESRDDTRHAA